MQTTLSPEFENTPEGEEAEAILRACVHCGFCTATCPTYQLLGDELDGPRGRIYLIKQVLEGEVPTAKTQLHLDRCLTCRNCETTCPSGVRYGRLVDIGRKIVDAKVGRTPAETAQRWALRKGLLARPLFGAALAFGRLAKNMLPRELGDRIPDRRAGGVWPSPRYSRTVVVVEGCVQPALAPNIDAAFARVLDRIGITALKVSAGGCCGAVPYHLSEHAEAEAMVRRNIDAWWPHIEGGAEAIVATSSGCGVMVRDYGHVLARDPAYAERARRVAALARDPVELIAAEWKSIAPRVAMDMGSLRVAFHPPCTLQHGMQLKGRVEELLNALGYEVLPVANVQQCCGSAGTYSILQPALAEPLKRAKVAALEEHRPQVIVSANIGCMTHIASGTAKPVRHWVELLDERMLSSRA